MASTWGKRRCSYALKWNAACSPCPISIGLLKITSRTQNSPPSLFCVKCFQTSKYLRDVFTSVFSPSLLLWVFVYDKIYNLHFNSEAWWWNLLVWCHHARGLLIPKREVKMTGCWPTSFSCVFMDRGQYPAILTSSLVNKGFIIWKSVILHDRCNEGCSSGKLLHLFSNWFTWCLLSAVSSNQLTRTKTGV